MRTNRTGFALPAALLALVIVGALVTGGFFAASQEDRISAVTVNASEAFIAAERGLQNILGTKNRQFFEDSICSSSSPPCDGVGDTTVVGPDTLSVGGLLARHTVVVKKLDTRMFLVQSTGEVLSGGRDAGAKRTLAHMMRTSYFYWPRDRTLTTADSVELYGSSLITGNDTIPSGWSGCTDTGEKTGVVAKDSSAVWIPAKGGTSGIDGSPPKDEDASFDSAQFSSFGDLTLDDLRRIADKTYAPGTYSGQGPVDDGTTCDTSVKDNWGDPNDPSGPCHTYWPIIHVTGSATFSSGVGQGILIVDGDLSLTGNFEFSGLVFVSGRLSTTGTGNKIQGSTTVLGSNASASQLGDITGGGSTNLILSTCAIERAAKFNDRLSRPYVLHERGFVDLSAIGYQY